jgi:hypothetical protein
VADAGLPWFLDPVVVVAGAFDHAGVAAVAPLWVELAGDLGVDAEQGVVPVLRGEKPPYR